MALQTSITQFQKPGARGLVAKAEARNLISRSLAIGAANVMFGVPVYRGATDDLCSGDSAAGDFLGLSRRSGVVNPASGGDHYVAADEVPIMTYGVMWVETGAAVVAGTPAGYDPATKLFGAVGAPYVAVAGVEFDTATSAAGLAIVRLVRTTPA